MDDAKLTPFLFQSTLPVKGATRLFRQRHLRRHVSIHAPREGSDVTARSTRLNICRFQSTLPVKGATENSFYRFRKVAGFNPRSP